MKGPEEILQFWLDEVGPSGWYEATDALDDKIRERFLTTWEAACRGELTGWLTSARGALAYIILLDQFPRNMFRGQGKAFSSDRMALCAAKEVVRKGCDMKIEEPARQFFYLPMMHSESLADQERCVRLMKERMPKSGANNLIHAKAHRQVIREFGRFPYRNEALDRRMTEPERAYVSNGGYGKTYQELRAAVG
jgi:uncharacterized protein (DUF924 family)